MLEHNCALFVAVRQRIDDEIRWLEEGKGEIVQGKELERLYKTTMSLVEDEIYKLKFLEIGAETEVFRIQALNGRLESGDKFTRDVLKTELKNIRQDLVLRLMKLKFAYIPAPNDKYFEQPKLFGELVYDKFPSAIEEIKDAGNCLAADLGTAAVFHLMRVAEKGIKTVLRDRQILTVQNKPIEMLDWKTIGDGLTQATDAINQWPGTLGLAKTQAQEFYNGIKNEFYGFKDAWRNHVMHDRKRYSFDEAKGISTHVERFMQTLAGRISEIECLPLIWTEAQIR
jgi:hypothetical protein